MTPTIASLFSATKIIDLIISKPVIKKAALDFISALAAKKSENNEASAVNICRIKIDELQLVWPDSRYPAMNAEAALTSDIKLESAKLETLEGKLNAVVTPDGDEQLIVVNANKWTMPVGLPLLIDNAKLEMHLKGSKLTIPKIDIALYGGKLTGDAFVSWEKSLKGNFRTTGKLNIANLALKQSTSMVSIAVYLSGNLFSNGGFSSIAKDVGTLADNLRANFTFKINNGVSHGLDLVKVASLLIKKSQNGGHTQFNAFSGV